MTDTLADRIRARLAATGKTANAASLAAGGSASLITNILLGRSRSPRIDTLRALAEVLDTSVEYLSGATDDPNRLSQKEQQPVTKPLRQEFVLLEQALPSPSTMPRDVPVWGSAMGSLVDGVEGVHLFTGEPVDYVRRPPALMNARDAYAFYVSGDSMEPMHPHGALRFAQPHKPVSPGDTVVVLTRQWDSDPGQGYIKILRRRTGEMLILEQLNPRATIQIPMKHVVSVHKVPDMNDLFGV